MTTRNALESGSIQPDKKQYRTDKADNCKKFGNTEKTLKTFLGSC